MFALLKSGADVALADGTVVRSSDVMGASELPRFVAVICDVDVSRGRSSGDAQNGGSSLLQMLVSDPYWARYGVVWCGVACIIIVIELTFMACVELFDWLIKQIHAYKVIQCNVM